MTRHLVCLSFDFDAFSGWIARGLTTPTPMSRGEFGAIGAERILTLLEKYNIHTTWFIPGVTIGTYPEICGRVAGAGHEIGNHGWTHTPPTKLTPTTEDTDLERANYAIQRLSGISVKGYRSPSWDLSPHTIQLLIKHGFLYDSSMMGNDHHPYRARYEDKIAQDGVLQFGPKTDLIEMPISWTLDDYPYFEFVRTETTILPGLSIAENVLKNWVDDFSFMRKTETWGVLTYTFHPFVIGRGHRMIILEKLIQRLIDVGAIFTTMTAAAQEFLEREPQTSAQKQTEGSE